MRIFWFRIGVIEMEKSNMLENYLRDRMDGFWRLNVRGRRLRKFYGFVLSG